MGFVKTICLVAFALLGACWLAEEVEARWVTVCNGDSCQQVWVDGPVLRQRVAARRYNSVMGTGRSYRFNGYGSNGGYGAVQSYGSNGGYGAVRSYGSNGGYSTQGYGSSGGYGGTTEAPAAPMETAKPADTTPAKGASFQRPKPSIGCPHNPNCPCGADCKCGPGCKCYLNRSGT